MKEFYLSFGHGHSHYVNGKTFNNDTICILEAKNYGEAREIAFQNFDDKFFTVYKPEDLGKDFLSHYPRGLKRLRDYTQEELKDILFKMDSFGGSFVAGIGRAGMSADQYNLKRLSDAFSNYFETYLKF